MNACWEQKPKKHKKNTNKQTFRQLIFKFIKQTCFAAFAHRIRVKEGKRDEGCSVEIFKTEDFVPVLLFARTEWKAVVKPVLHPRFYRPGK